MTNSQLDTTTRVKRSALSQQVTTQHNHINRHAQRHSKLKTEQSLKGGWAGLSESTLVKLPQCWKSHVTAHIIRSLLLYCREDSKISHYIVNKIQVGGNVMFRIGDHQFPDISSLLNFYKTHYLDTTALTYPVSC